MSLQGHTVETSFLQACHWRWTGEGPLSYICPPGGPPPPGPPRPSWWVAVEGLDVFLQQLSLPFTLSALEFTPDH